jgi:hypothetical protein
MPLQIHPNRENHTTLIPIAFSRLDQYDRYPANRKSLGWGSAIITILQNFYPTFFHKMIQNRRLSCH